MKKLFLLVVCVASAHAMNEPTNPLAKELALGKQFLDAVHDVEAVQEVCKQGLDINCLRVMENGKQVTKRPILIALGSGAESTARLLITLGAADLTKKENKDLLKLCIDQGINPQIILERSSANNEQLLDALIRSLQYNPLFCNQQSVVTRLEQEIAQGKEYLTALYDTDKLKTLISQGLKINHRITVVNNGQIITKSLLDIAIIERHLAAIEILIEKASDADLAKEENNDLLTLFFEHAIDPRPLLRRKISTKEQLQAALKKSIGQSDCPYVATLIEYGADARDEELTRIIRKTKCNYKILNSRLSLLVKNGLPLDVQDKKKRTILFDIAQRGLSGLIDQMIGAGANPNHQDINGDTPLALASDQGTACRLLQGGANLFIKNNSGWTMYDRMVRHLLFTDANRMQAIMMLGVFNCFQSSAESSKNEIRTMRQEIGSLLQEIGCQTTVNGDPA